MVIPEGFPIALWTPSGKRLLGNIFVLDDVYSRGLKRGEAPRPLEPFGGRLTCKALGTVRESILSFHKSSSSSEGDAKESRGRPQSPLENLT